MKAKIFVLWILLLTAIDQLMKIIIDTYFFENQIDIIPYLLEFKPVFNSNYSYLNAILNKEFDIDIGFLPHIILYIVLQGIVINVYVSFKVKLNTSYLKILDVAIIFQISAFLCALIGNVFWSKGVLDYIYLKPLFTFDLKDIYASIFIFLSLLYAIKNKEQKNINLLNVKDVIAYIKKQLSSGNM